jgi:hypothetical protein
LPVQPAFDLLPGPAVSWKAILPSLAVIGEPFRLCVVAEDKSTTGTTSTPGLRMISRTEFSFEPQDRD